MNISVKDLFDYKIQAEDGEIGSVSDVLVDDADWTARYLVVDTGGWLFGRKVMIAPVAAREPDAAGKLLPVRLTKQEIKDSPDIASDPPLSRDQEIAYHDHYRWPYYWLGGGNVGFGHADALAEVPLTPLPRSEPEAGSTPPVTEDRDYSLRSVKHLIGQKLLSHDGEIARIADFLLEVDGDIWHAPYLVAELDSNRHVLAPTAAIEKVGWPDQDVLVRLSPELLFGAPDFDETVVRDAMFLGRVRDYYGSHARA